MKGFRIISSGERFVALGPAAFGHTVVDVAPDVQRPNIQFRNIAELAKANAAELMNAARQFGNEFPHSQGFDHTRRESGFNSQVVLTIRSGPHKGKSISVERTGYSDEAPVPTKLVGDVQGGHVRASGEYSPNQSLMGVVWKQVDAAAESVERQREAFDFTYKEKAVDGVLGVVGDLVSELNGGKKSKIDLPDEELAGGVELIAEWAQGDEQLHELVEQWQDLFNGMTEEDQQNLARNFALVGLAGVGVWALAEMATRKSKATVSLLLAITVGVACRNNPGVVIPLEPPTAVPTETVGGSGHEELSAIVETVRVQASLIHNEAALYDAVNEKVPGAFSGIEKVSWDESVQAALITFEPRVLDGARIMGLGVKDKDGVLDLTFFSPDLPTPSRPLPVTTEGGEYALRTFLRWIYHRGEVPGLRWDVENATKESLVFIYVPAKNVTVSDDGFVDEFDYDSSRGGLLFKWGIDEQQNPDGNSVLINTSYTDLTPTPVAESTVDPAETPLIHPTPTPVETTVAPTATEVPVVPGWAEDELKDPEVKALVGDEKWDARQQAPMRTTEAGGKEIFDFNIKEWIDLTFDGEKNGIHVSMAGNWSPEALAFLQQHKDVLGRAVVAPALSESGLREFTRYWAAFQKEVLGGDKIRDFRWTKDFSLDVRSHADQVETIVSEVNTDELLLVYVPGPRLDLFFDPYHYTAELQRMGLYAGGWQFVKGTVADYAFKYGVQGDRLVVYVMAYSGQGSEQWFQGDAGYLTEETFEGLYVTKYGFDDNVLFAREEMTDDTPEIFAFVQDHWNKRPIFTPDSLSD